MAWTNKKTAMVIGVGVAVILAILLTTVLEFQRTRAHRRHHLPSWALSPISKDVTINLQADGSVTFEGTIEETNATRMTLLTDEDNSGSEKLTRITDDSGKPMKFSKRAGGYHITLNQPVPPGGTVSYTVEGEVEGFIRPDAEGVCQVGFASEDGNISDMHCVEVWRLPPGATLLKEDQGLEANTNAGQVELRIDQIVPPNGWLKLAFKYRLLSNLR